MLQSYPVNEKEANYTLDAQSNNQHWLSNTMGEPVFRPLESEAQRG